MSDAATLPGFPSATHGAPGHNSAGAAVFEDDVATFLKGWDVWAERPTLDDVTAPRARDFLAGAQQLVKKLDAARREAKLPHERAAKAVDEDFNKPKARLEAVITGIKVKINAYADALAKAEAARRAEAARAAQEAREAAAAAAMDATNAPTASARIDADMQAAELAKTAAAAEKEAARVAPVRIESATGLAKGLGVRRRRVCTLKSLPLACAHFKDAPELRDVLERLANAECRAAGIDTDVRIPGFEITTTEGV